MWCGDLQIEPAWRVWCGDLQALIPAIRCRRVIRGIQNRAVYARIIGPHATCIDFNVLFFEHSKEGGMGWGRIGSVDNMWDLFAGGPGLIPLGVFCTAFS